MTGASFDPDAPAWLDRRFPPAVVASALTEQDRADLRDPPFLPPVAAESRPGGWTGNRSDDMSDTAKPGHNGPAGFAADQLRSFVERIERLEEEKATIGQDVKDVYAEAKGTGFDVKVMRKVIRLRKMDKAERDEAEATLDLYMQALGMQLGLPFDEGEDPDHLDISDPRAIEPVAPKIPA
jgi:uncharacterized protein (UPF0335 family)